MHIDECLSLLSPFCLYMTPVGSRITCDPPPMDTDLDYLLLLKFGKRKKVMDVLINTITITDQTDSYGTLSDFFSVRHNEINFIVTHSLDFYDKFMAATSVAKKFNLMEKEDRIILFEAVISSKSCDPQPKKEKKSMTIDYMAITRSFF